jgi:hypothetical protein
MQELRALAHCRWAELEDERDAARALALAAVLHAFVPECYERIQPFIASIPAMPLSWRRRRTSKGRSSAAWQAEGYVGILRRVAIAV